MRLKVFFALVLVAAMLFAGFAAGPVKAPFTLKIKERRITTNTAAYMNSAVYGNIIVWDDQRNGATNGDVYMYDLSTSTETRITTNSANQSVPAVYGNVIAWRDDRNGKWDIYMAQIFRDSDINNDGKVDITDLALVAKWFGKTVPPAPSDVDINYDYKIDIKDLASMAKDYGLPRPPGTTWSKTYGGTNADWGYSVIATADGGYAIAGRTNSFGAGGYDVYLVKTDVSGNMQWSKTYGGTGSDEAYSLVQTVDGGYAIAGETESFGAGSADIYLVKTDPDLGLSRTDSTANTITLYRGATDPYWNYVRVRIWKVKENP